MSRPLADAGFVGNVIARVEDFRAAHLKLADRFRVFTQPRPLAETRIVRGNMTVADPKQSLINSSNTFARSAITPTGNDIGLLEYDRK